MEAAEELVIIKPKGGKQNRVTKWIKKKLNIGESAERLKEIDARLKIASDSILKLSQHF